MQIKNKNIIFLQLYYFKNKLMYDNIFVFKNPFELNFFLHSFDPFAYFPFSSLLRRTYKHYCKLMTLMRAVINYCQLIMHNFECKIWMHKNYLIYCAPHDSLKLNRTKHDFKFDNRHLFYYWIDLRVLMNNFISHLTCAHSLINTDSFNSLY